MLVESSSAAWVRHVARRFGVRGWGIFLFRQRSNLGAAAYGIRYCAYRKIIAVKTVLDFFFLFFFWGGGG